MRTSEWRYLPKKRRKKGRARFYSITKRYTMVFWHCRGTWSKPQTPYEAKAERIDEAVAEGKLTKAQADYRKAVLKAQLDYYKAEGYEKSLGFGAGLGMKDFGRSMRGLGPCWQAPATNGQ